MADRVFLVPQPVGIMSSAKASHMATVCPCAFSTPATFARLHVSGFSFLPIHPSYWQTYATLTMGLTQKLPAIIHACLTLSCYSFLQFMLILHFVYECWCSGVLYKVLHICSWLVPTDLSEFSQRLWEFC